MTSSDAPTPREIRAAAAALAETLDQHLKYALVGGAACVVLGSTRTTDDIDVVVPRGQTPAARQLLRASPSFKIEILAPPALFRENFDHTTEVITVENVKVLKPALILNAKCRSIIGRPSEARRATDSQDIVFLLEYCAQNPAYLPNALEVPNATREFVQMFIQKYGYRDSWTGAGYNLEAGLFCHD